MFKKFYPCEYADSVFAIDYRKLYDQGFRGIIFDIDNTLVHHGDDATPEIDRLFAHIHSLGFRTVLLTDNNEARVKRFIRNIQTAYICEAGKPQPAPFLRAVDMLGLDKSRTVCIGDQMFMDILGANRSGIPSILVRFIRLDTEKKIGKKRQLERLLLSFYRRNRSAQHRLGDILKDRAE